MWRTGDTSGQDLRLGADHATGRICCGTRSARTSRCGGGAGESDSGLAGHQDLSTTQRYMHHSPAAVENAIRLLESPGFVPSRGDIVESVPCKVSPRSR